jgi:hypothetical protein
VRDTDPFVFISSTWYASQGTGAISSLAADTHEGQVNVVGTMQYTISGSNNGPTGYFHRASTGNYFEFPQLNRRMTMTIYLAFKTTTATFAIMGADPGGYGNLDSQVGLGASGNNFIQAGIQPGEMFFSTHYSGGVNDGVHSDGKVLNNGEWHWVEFQSSLDEANYKLAFNDGVTFTHTNVNAGFGREDVNFMLFRAQGDYANDMEVAEFILYDRILEDAERETVHAFLTAAIVGGSKSPTSVPSESPTPVPSTTPTEVPTESPTPVPSESPTPVPSATPTGSPTPVPSESPTPVPPATPTGSPTPVPSESPTPVPSATPTESPTPVPSATPTEVPTESPTPVPSGSPTPMPTRTTESPTPAPSETPTPTKSPTPVPTKSPTAGPHTPHPTPPSRAFCYKFAGFVCFTCHMRPPPPKTKHTQTS